MGAALEERQLDHPSLVFGKAVECFANLALSLGGLEGKVGRRRFPLLHKFMDLVEFGALISPESIDAKIARDGEDPGRYGGSVRIVTLGLPPDGYQRVLGNILGDLACCPASKSALSGYAGHKTGTAP